MNRSTTRMFIAAATLLAAHGTVLPALAQTAAQPAATRPPALGPVKNLVLPPMVERTLPNGLKLVIVEQLRRRNEYFVAGFGGGCAQHVDAGHHRNGCHAERFTG